MDGSSVALSFALFLWLLGLGTVVYFVNLPFWCIQALIAISAIATEPETMSRGKQAVSSYGNRPGIPSIIT